MPLVSAYYLRPQIAQNVDNVNKIVKEDGQSVASEIADRLALHCGTWQIAANFGVDCSPTSRGNGNILPAKTWM